MNALSGFAPGSAYCEVHEDLNLIQDEQTKEWFCLACRPQPELLQECHCCQHPTLLSRGMWEYCPVCGWEDGDCLVDGLAHIESVIDLGDDEFEVTNSQPIEDAVSDCNHISLRQARQNYRKFGAYCQQARRHAIKWYKFVELIQSGRPYPRR